MKARMKRKSEKLKYGHIKCNNFYMKKTQKIGLFEEGLNTFFVLIFVVFDANGPHFTKCLKWSSFSQFVFNLDLLFDVV